MMQRRIPDAENLINDQQVTLCVQAWLRDDREREMATPFKALLNTLLTNPTPAKTWKKLRKDLNINEALKVTPEAVRCLR